jgi:hypothetical protein
VRLWFEIASIFLNCVLLSLNSYLYGYGRLSHPDRDRKPTPLRECMFRLAMAAPFGLFAFGAVIQNQLHQGMLARLPGLLITALFIAYPLAGMIVVEHLWNRLRRRLAERGGWSRPVHL